ncbi:SAVED domain-containing protein [Haliangium ochraceum]|uniref:SMODS-associated and fused to various effectors domain-containing protein n=1 Tax=Haliangium ochraceum (strain DSM 14365 / JCM 11303 / SMP-2) TaxID=502025 RepID=D0LHT2_HALO1|nr:SAVED domain-containing protein [Haliangium ochraceum]ACY14761.1 hypothetical protein Hoch_2216 [Haliangium ochraceum DSM 14365]
MTQASAPEKFILLSQSGLFPIAHEDMARAASAYHPGCLQRELQLDLREASAHALASGDWSAARRAVDEAFAARIEPVREQCPGYTFLYFGSAPVPLAFHLGTRLGTGAIIDIVPRDHATGAWQWRERAPRAELVPATLPDERDRSEGVAIVRVSSSHRVDPVLTRELVREQTYETLLFEVDIALRAPAEDAFSNVAEMCALAAEFRRVLDAIGERFPGIRRVHLFASVQPGVALLLGAQVSRMHPEIQTYQYRRDGDRGARHEPALVSNGRGRRPPRVLSDDEIQRAAQDRVHLSEDLERMKGFADNASERSNATGDTWLHQVLGARESERAPALQAPPWAFLPPLVKTELMRTEIEREITSVDDSFCLDADSKRWRLDDRWLAQLAERLPDDGERRCALRLLLLHEAAHRGPQGLTRATSQGMGRFPKVLEEIDYHADLWAMLHERALEALQPTRGELGDVAGYFCKLIGIATETMWAFDDGGEPLPEIQIRRLNRYLIWYWQWLHLKVAGQSSGSERLTLAEALEILSSRPHIELAGPRIRAHDQRVFYLLEDRPSVPELAVYHEGKLFRFGHTLPFDIPTLLSAIAARDGEAALEILRAAAEHILR